MGFDDRQLISALSGLLAVAFNAAAFSPFVAVQQTSSADVGRTLLWLISDTLSLAGLARCGLLYTKMAFSGVDICLGLTLVLLMLRRSHHVRNHSSTVVDGEKGIAALDCDELESRRRLRVWSRSLITFACLAVAFLIWAVPYVRLRDRSTAHDGHGTDVMISPDGYALGWLALSVGGLANATSVIVAWRHKAVRPLEGRTYILKFLAHVSYVISLPAFSDSRPYIIRQLPWLLLSVSTIIVDNCHRQMWLIYRHSKALTSIGPEKEGIGSASIDEITSTVRPATARSSQSTGSSALAHDVTALFKRDSLGSTLSAVSEAVICQGRKAQRRPLSYPSRSMPLSLQLAYTHSRSRSGPLAPPRLVVTPSPDQPRSGRITSAPVCF